MTDDLVKRARDGTILIRKAEFDGRGDYDIDADATDELMFELASRIEALTAERDAAKAKADDVYSRFVFWRSEADALRAQVGELSDKVKALEAEIVAREKTAYIKGTTDVWGIFKQD